MSLSSWSEDAAPIHERSCCRWCTPVFSAIFDFKKKTVSCLCHMTVNCLSSLLHVTRRLRKRRGAIVCKDKLNDNGGVLDTRMLVSPMLWRRVQSATYLHQSGRQGGRYGSDKHKQSKNTSCSNPKIAEKQDASNYCSRCCWESFSNNRSRGSLLQYQVKSYRPTEDILMLLWYLLASPSNRQGGSWVWFVYVLCILQRLLAAGETKYYV